MKILSKLFDHRIKAYNILTELPIEEYLPIAQQILQNNPFQRKRVKSSSSVYSLLREDLKVGCVIPPLVLALSNENSEISFDDLTKSNDKIINLIKNNIDKLIILDGLQRTYTLIDVKERLQQQDNTILHNFYSHKLRFEVYLGINKLGILYRMLTLNTGQSPMSLRHQLEILYSDYLNHNIEGITLIREVDDQSPEQLNEYRFNDVIDGFTSYILRDESTLDRNDLLENIKSLEKLALENQDRNLFKNYLSSYHKFILKMRDITNNWSFDNEQIRLFGIPFGDNVVKIFKKPQVMTGFGAAVGFIKDKELIESFDDIFKMIDKISFKDQENIDGSMKILLRNLDAIKQSAKKIGNAQRMYLYYFFRELFNSESDSYLFVDESIESSYDRYQKLND